MDLVIEPVSVASWPIYRRALAAHQLPVPTVRPRRGLMLTRVVNEKKEAVAGGCLYIAGDAAMLLHGFSRAWAKKESEAAIAPWMTQLGMSLKTFGLLLGAQVVVALPWTDNAAKAFASMGFAKPVPALIG